MGKILSNIKILSRLPMTVLFRRVLSRFVKPRVIQLELKQKNSDILWYTEHLAVDTNLINDICNNIIHIYENVDFGEKVRWDYTSDKFLLKDVRITWELGRMHFLKDLAIEGGDRARQKYVELITSFIEAGESGESKNQWTCAMEVGIRLSNWLVSYSIFKNKKDFDPDFNTLFDEACQTHIQYVWNNLEHKEGIANNHYLFNLSSLLFAGLYYEIPSHYFEFLKDQFLLEFDKQFFNDGGNFEGSTAYHLHAIEAISIGLSCLVNTNFQLDNKIWEKWKNCLSLAKVIIDNTGKYLRFGDDDNGYFLEQIASSPAVNKKWLFEVIDAWEGNASETTSLSALLIRLCLKDFKLEARSYSWKAKRVEFEFLDHHQETIISFEPINLELVEPFAFLEFGLFGYQSREFKLGVSGISNPNMHCSWGHVHNDQMSFELMVNGEAKVKSPGTYVYNADPNERNSFRSVNAQHGINVGEEPNHWENTQWGLFYLSRDSRVQLLKMNKTELILLHSYKKYKHIRRFTIQSEKLTIDDWCNFPFKVNVNQFEWYSPVYGQKERIS